MDRCLERALPLLDGKRVLVLFGSVLGYQDAETASLIGIGVTRARELRREMWRSVQPHSKVCGSGCWWRAWWEGSVFDKRQGQILAAVREVPSREVVALLRAFDRRNIDELDDDGELWSAGKPPRGLPTG